MRREGRIHGYEFDRQQGLARVKASVQPTNRSKFRSKWPQEKAGRPSYKALKKSKGQRNKGHGADMVSNHRMHEWSLFRAAAAAAAAAEDYYFEDDIAYDADLFPFVDDIAYDADLVPFVDDMPSVASDDDLEYKADCAPLQHLIHVNTLLDPQHSLLAAAVPFIAVATAPPSDFEEDEESNSDCAPTAIATAIAIAIAPHSELEEEDESNSNCGGDWLDLGASNEEEEEEEGWFLC